jgi:outer membrane protein
MRKFCCGWGISILIIIFFSPMSAFSMGVEAAVGLWWQDPSGDMGSKGNDLSVENELKYESESRVYGRIKVDMPAMIPNIYLMATPVIFEEDGSKNTSFKFGDKTFAGNESFSSKLRLNHYDVALYYGIPFLKTVTLGTFNMEVGLNGRILDIKEEIKQPTAGTEWVSLAVPIPMLYLGAQLKPMKYLSLEAEARGVSYSSTHNYDLIARLKVQPFGPVFLAGGYRYENVKIDQGDIKINMKIKGPFLELGFVF